MGFFQRLTIEKISLAVAFFLLLATWYQAYIARETMHQSLRAYISMDSADIRKVDRPPGPGESENHIDVRFEDGGATPAYNVVLSVSFIVATAPILIESTLREDPKTTEQKVQRIHGMLSPHIPVAHYVPISPEQLSQLQTGQRILYVHGHVSYDDVFHDRHTRVYCFQYDGKENVFILCDTHNDEYEGDYQPVG